MHPKVSENHTSKLKKCTPGLPWDPARDHTRKKITNYALEGVPREPKLDHKTHPKGAPERPSDALLWSKAAVVSTEAFKHILKRFLLLFS